MITKRPYKQCVIFWLLIIVNRISVKLSLLLIIILTEAFRLKYASASTDISTLGTSSSLTALSLTFSIFGMIRLEIAFIKISDSCFKFIHVNFVKDHVLTNTNAEYICTSSTFSDLSNS
uniref:ORF OR26.27 protein n=1 Tax=Saccharomyces cerevisiae TaxID=4932 RepID=E9PA80_YEASX|nr:ORF OR26.27 [Saccharomyces cerevisiae]